MRFGLQRYTSPEESHTLTIAVFVTREDGLLERIGNRYINILNLKVLGKHRFLKFSFNHYFCLNSYSDLKLVVLIEKLIVKFVHANLSSELWRPSLKLLSSVGILPI